AVAQDRHTNVAELAPDWYGGTAELAHLHFGRDETRARSLDDKRGYGEDEVISAAQRPRHIEWIVIAAHLPRGRKRLRITEDEPRGRHRRHEARVGGRYRLDVVTVERGAEKRRREPDRHAARPP